MYSAPTSRRPLLSLLWANLSPPICALSSSRQSRSLPPAHSCSLHQLAGRSPRLRGDVRPTRRGPLESVGRRSVTRGRRGSLPEPPGSGERPGPIACPGTAPRDSGGEAGTRPNTTLCDGGAHRWRVPRYALTVRERTMLETGAISAPRWGDPEGEQLRPLLIAECAGSWLTPGTPRQGQGS